MDAEYSETNPKIVENSISVQMSEKNAKYSKNPGKNQKKIQKKFNTKQKKITKIFLNKCHIKVINANL